MLTIAVIGAGYVGLVTGACFAQKGNRVIIVENNQTKIDLLLEGKIPFYEPHLSDIVKQGLLSKNLSFVNNIQAGLAAHPSIIFLCVGTPSLPNGAADLSYVEHAAHELGMNVQNYTLIVNKSTVPIGTADKVKTIVNTTLQQRQCSFTIDVASNPEFLKEGDAVHDFLHPDRIIIGVENEEANKLLTTLYTPFITPGCQLLCMDIRSAELTKYASNGMLALRISYMNQLSHLADLAGANIDHVKRGMAHDKRIGSYFLNAGVGYGGSCFPKDIQALVDMGTQHHFPMTLIQEIENVNHFQRVWFINRITTHYGPQLARKTAGIWGLAFKPETDDIRCAPSLDVIDELLIKGTKIITYDPVAEDRIKSIYANRISYASTARDVLDKADFLIILTEWKEFFAYTESDFFALNDKTIFDGRNCYDPSTMSAAGLQYFCVGRNNITPKNSFRRKESRQQSSPQTTAL